MREILFRGKRLHDNKWIYGNFVSDCGGNPHIIESRFFCEDGHHLQYEDNTDTPVFIIPETVGQYTGLTDKNGVRIFEGDIVERVSDGEQAVISWLKYFACFGLSFDGWCCGFDNYDDNLPSDFEVIGNIHDNPELLKGGGDNG